MGPALLVCRVLLAGVFVFAGVAKLADLAGSRRAVADFGVPARWAGVTGVWLPICEVLVGVALIVGASARFGAVGAGVLLLAFSAAIANALARGRSPDCHCFGQVHSAPAGWRTLARNLLLLGVAGFVAVAGWGNPGVSATGWVTRLGGAWLVAIVAGVLVLALVGFQVWFSLQLLSQNGRALGRLQALEEALAEVTGALGLAPDRVAERGALGQGLHGAGLAVGSRAPEFDLEGVDGEHHSLGSLLASSRQLLLVFSAAGCGPCHALMPELARWQREHAGELEIVVVAAGDPEHNRAKATEHGLGRVLLQSEHEVSDAYQAAGTPMAVVIGPDGAILSPTVGGAEAITTLVAQATRPLLAVRPPAPSAHSHANGNGAAAVRPPPDPSRVGEPAPDLVLSDLDGARVALTDLYAESTLAIFWNPACGFCQRMLDDLKAFEDDPPAGAPRIIVISAGEPDAVRPQQLGSLVLLDPEGTAMRAFDAHGTPMGLLIERGRIASRVAAGADAVFELARSSAP